MLPATEADKLPVSIMAPVMMFPSCPSTEADRLHVGIMAPVVMFPSCPATEADRLTVSICQGTIPTVSALSVNFVPEKFVCSNYFSYLCIVPAMPL